MTEIANLPLTSPQVGDGFIVRRGINPALVELPDFSGGPAPHTHPIADVAGLQAALDGKQASGSYATGAQGALAETALQPLDVSLVATTGLYADLLSVPATFPPSTHNHIISDTTGLQTALDGKASALGVDDNYVTDAEKTKLSLLSGTNTGDQTSIVGVSGTKAQFNTAVSDGDFLYVGDVSGVSDGDKGDITVSASGATWTIDAASVTLAKMANVATGSVFYRKTAATGVPEVQTLATLKTDLGLTGTNSGDQTSIVGITGTKAQFDTAITDGNIQYVGDAPTAHTHLLAAGATDVTITATNLNILDDGVDTTLHFHAADRARAVHTGTQLASTISDFSTAVAATASVTANTAKVSNATHTGDVTGSTALTIDPTAISGKTLVTAVGTDHLLILDATDGLLKKALASDLVGGGGATNLSYTAATRVIASDTGTDATLPLVTTGDAGLAPASGGGTTNFLRADGTWAAPAGGGGGGASPIISWMI